MEVNCRNFWKTLPKILESISSAEYVSFDLEMTGIRFKDHASTGRPTPERVYDQAKAGAESFQILQFGMTCFRYYNGGRGYTSRTFNFAITPLFTDEERQDRVLAKVLDRSITFSYRALLFLKSHAFCLEDAFAEGVPYLSRHEAEEMREYFLQLSHENKPLDLEDQSRETREFYHAIRTQVSSWLADPTSEDFLNIENPCGGRLNSLQIRLLYQLIERDFSDSCRGFARQGNWFFQIRPVTKEEQQQFWKKRISERQDALVRQRAFQYVIEALVGGNFADEINAEWLVPPGPDRATSVEEMARDLKKYQEKLKTGRPVIIGHNQLHDFCFVYRNFFGPLPGTIQEFAREIHALFPRVIDTKHLSIREDHDMVPDFNLAELYALVKIQEQPIITQECGFHYLKETAHDAGFDSWITAVLATKLSFSRFQEDFSSTTDRPPTSTSRTSRTGIPEPLSPRRALFADLNPFKSARDQGGVHASWLSQKANNMTDKDTQVTASPKLEQVRGVRNTRSDVRPPHATAIQKKAPGNRDAQAPRIPQWESTFWNKYGNKLRVGNAGVLDLGQD